MKLLLDENLSRRLVPFLQNQYPGTIQVVSAGLEQAGDREIWQYARAGGFVIVSRDSDFLELAAMLGHPPQVIRLGTPNQSKATTLKLLLDNQDLIENALVSENLPCIELRSGSAWL